MQKLCACLINYNEMLTDTKYITFNNQLWQFGCYIAYHHVERMAPLSYELQDLIVPHSKTIYEHFENKNNV